MPTYLQAFATALMFLTRIPIDRLVVFECERDHRSLATQFYPLVGLLVGGLLIVVWKLLPLLLGDTSPVLQAVVLVAVWVALTGALHLDGFADCVDASFAGHVSAEKIRTVFKDPHIGSMAVVALVLLLLLKVALLAHLISLGSGLWVILAPVLARWLALLYMRSTIYVSVNGLATGIRVQDYDVSIVLQGLALLLLLCFVFGFWATLFIAFALLLCLWFWRGRWLAKINGYNGDCVGALIELEELVFLILLVGIL